MADLISIRECSRRLGVSDTAVHKAIKSGRITVADRNPKNNRPLVDFDTVLKAWRANTDAGMQRTGGGSGHVNPKSKVALASAPPPVADGESPEEGGDPELPDGVPNLNASKAVKEHFLAKRAKLEYEREAGLQVYRSEVNTEAFNLGRQLRDSIMAVPDRIDAELAAETDPRKINLRLKQELIVVLAKLETMLTEHA